MGHGGAWWCKGANGIVTAVISLSKSWFRVAGYHSINGPLVDAIKEAMDDTTRISLLKKLTEA